MTSEDGWSKLIFLTALWSAIFGALYSTNDNFIMHHIIVCPNDSFTATAFYLIVGGWIGTLLTLVLNRFLGKSMDKSYTGFNFGSLKMQKFALLSGIFGAVSTLLYLWGSQKLDPSLVLGLSSASVIWLCLYDSLTKKIKVRSIIVPLTLVVVGSLIASTTRLSGGFKITFLGIIILLVGRCGLDAADGIVRKLGGNDTDAVIFNFWRFFWLSVSATILMIVVAFLRGTSDELWQMKDIFLPTLPWILLTMFFVFLSNVLCQKAMQKGVVSKVFLVTNSKIAIGVPIALLGDAIYPGVFGQLPTEPIVWIVRFAGVVLTAIGVMQLLKERDNIKI